MGLPFELANSVLFWYSSVLQQPSLRSGTGFILSSLEQLHRLCFQEIMAAEGWAYACTQIPQSKPP